MYKVRVKSLCITDHLCELSTATRMLELDEWDELLTNTFTASTHHNGPRNRGITSGHDNVEDASLSEALSSHPLRNPSIGKAVGGIEIATGATRPRLTHITRTRSEEDPDCPTVVEATNITAHNADCHDVDILHTVCPSHLDHVISRRNFHS